MKDALTYLLKQIVAKEDELSVSEEDLGNGNVALSVSVAAEDMGKVIGRGGKIIKSLRNLIRIIAVKQQKRVEIILNESTGQKG